MRRLSLREILVLNGYWVGLSFMWNSLHLIVLPAVLLNFVPDSLKNSYLGLLTFLGLVLATIVQPLAGALSDRWASRWGRRRPLIVIGTAVDFLFLAFLGWAGGLWMLYVGYLGLQISSNLAHGALQGLLPDRVPPEQLGSASGIKTMMDMAGLVVASFVMGRVISPGTQHPVVAMLAVALVLAVGGAVTVAGAGEASSERPAEPPRSLSELFRETFHVDLAAHAGYWWLIGSRFLYLLGVYGIQQFAQYYLQDRLKVPNPPKATGDLMAALVLALIVFAVGAGWLADRWGRRRVLAVAGVVGAVGSLLLLAARTVPQLMLYGSVFGAGLGMFLSANWALATDLAPATEAGKFLGLTNLATAGAGALGRLEGPAIDLLNRARPGQWWGYIALFLFGGVCTLLSIVLLVKVPERRAGVSQLP